MAIVAAAEIAMIQLSSEVSSTAALAGASNSNSILHSPDAISWLHMALSAV
jgi:hypothetical protein